jgi:hypothetical protein
MFKREQPARVECGNLHGSFDAAIEKARRDWAAAGWVWIRTAERQLQHT